MANDTEPNNSAWQTTSASFAKALKNEMSIKRVSKFHIPRTTPDLRTQLIHTGCLKKCFSVWFDESWKQLDLHDLFLYFLDPQTST